MNSTTTVRRRLLYAIAMASVVVLAGCLGAGSQALSPAGETTGSTATPAGASAATTESPGASTETASSTATGDGTSTQDAADGTETVSSAPDDAAGSSGGDGSSGSQSSQASEPSDSEATTAGSATETEEPGTTTTGTATVETPTSTPDTPTPESPTTTTSGTSTPPPTTGTPLPPQGLVSDCAQPVVNDPPAKVVDCQIEDYPRPKAVVEVEVANAGEEQIDRIRVTLLLFGQDGTEVERDVRYVEDLAPEEHAGYLYETETDYGDLSKQYVIVVQVVE